MSRNNHHIDEAEFGLSVGISHLMVEKGEVFYSRQDTYKKCLTLSEHWRNLKRSLHITL